MTRRHTNDMIMMVSGISYAQYTSFPFMSENGVLK